jgi:hypothetical protein
VAALSLVPYRTWFCVGVRAGLGLTVEHRLYMDLYRGSNTGRAFVGSDLTDCPIADNQVDKVRFQVFTATSMKMIVFWDVASCSLVEIGRRLRGACCLHHQGDRQFIPHCTAQHPIRQSSSIRTCAHVILFLWQYFLKM